MICKVPPSTSLSARLDAISNSHAPTSLWLVLTIYHKASHICYINQMRGFKALVSYLAPIETPKYRTILITPPILHSYELQEVSRYLEIDQDIVYTCMVKEVLPRISRNTGTLGVRI